MTDRLRGYGAVARRFYERAARARLPLSGMLELTHRCNLACVHCYVNLAAGDREAKRREMTTAEVCGVVDELAEVGTLKLTLTGGEPLLRSDFAEIYTHAHGKGILLDVYTSGTLITEDVARLFRDHPPAKVELTQYGYTRETYEQVVNTGGRQFDRFHRGIELLREHGVRFALKTMAMCMNAGEVARMSEFAAGLAVEFRFDAVISPRIDGGRGPVAQRLSPREIDEVEMSVAEQAELSWDEYCTVGGEHDDRYYACGAGRATFVIDPYGALHVCELSRVPGWDVVRDGFARGWYEAIPALLAARRETAGCASCDVNAACSNCAGMAELEVRAVAEPDPYFCEITDDRYRRAYGERRPRPAGLVPLRLSRDAEPLGAR